MSIDDTTKTTGVQEYRDGAAKVYKPWADAGENYAEKTDAFTRALGIVRHAEQPDLTTGNGNYTPAANNVIVSFRTSNGGVIKYDDLSGETMTHTLPPNYEHPVMCTKIYSYDNGSTGITVSTDIIVYELVGVI